MNAPYDILYHYKDIHRVVLELAEGLNDDQLHWRPEDYSTSIGFHLWHLARESDFLRAALLEHYPQLSVDSDEVRQIWVRDNLAERWGFPTDLHATVGTGLSDEDAATLPIPPKAELLDYLRDAYQDLEQFIEQFDMRYPSFDGMDENLARIVQNVRLNLMVFLTHDCRHLGMMECIKGLQTGFGSATETRKQRSEDDNDTISTREHERSGD